MQDPYFAVKEEVAHSVSVVLELHKKWLALDRRGDEFEWTSSELLSGLRSIEWDLQDLEDTVSIVEGNRVKFQLEEADVRERKQFIEDTRKQVVAIRDEVQGNSGEMAGFSTSKGSSLPGISSISKAKGYGKVGSEDTIQPAEEDLESGAKPAQSDTADEILGAELEAGGEVSSADSRRHRKKKLCLGSLLLLLVIGGIVASASGMMGASHGDEAHHSDSATAHSAAPPVAAAPNATRLLQDVQRNGAPRVVQQSRYQQSDAR